ncbi:hypothetical protein COBE111412_09355 [Corynebacterium belfantii]
MVANITHGHPTGVQGDDHVIKLRQTAGAFRQHLGCKRAIPRIDGLGIRPVAVIASLGGANLGFRLAAGIAIAQVCIHFCLKTSVD